METTNSLYYVLTDHLGSWEKVLDENKNTVQQTHFDPWGNRMSHTAWASPQTQVSFPFSRGFTGHEHYDRFGIVNANARLYDPAIGRFFSPDPFVQMPDFTQSFNRYSYCMNNPVMYSDPDGESFTAAILIIGTVVGMYTGGVLANNSKNPLEWDYSSKTTWGYMIGGGLTGLASAGAGLAVAATDIAFCNTLGMIASSMVNSAGTWLYTDGKTDFTINFGIASYNLTKKEWGYIGKENYYHKLDYLAYYNEVQNAKYNGLSLYQFRQVINSCYYNARLFGMQNLPLFSNYGFNNYWSWLKNSLGL